MPKQYSSTSNSSLGGLIRKLENDYTRNTTTISKYVQFDMHRNIEKVDAYLNSKHTSGEIDSQGREKPFFNIVTAATNIWYRATDIDRKDIKIKATRNKDVIGAFIATIHLDDWMRRDRFGYFLNEWGRTLARFGSAVVKFVKKRGVLHAETIQWNHLIVDPIEFEDNPVIEILELTEAQLRKRPGYDKDAVEALIGAAKARETLEGFNKDDRNYYYKLYEIHGDMTESLITGNEEDEDNYVQQMHVISFMAGKESTEENPLWDDFTLIKGREKNNPYMITHLIKEDGRTQSIGAVEHLFEAQWMVNHSSKAIKDELDLASKLIFQTSDTNYVGRNALTNIEIGDIMVHKINEPLTQINNGSKEVTAWGSFMDRYLIQGDNATNVSESMKGANPPSGQAWRLTEALLNESRSLFEMMTENKGLHIEDMFRTHIIPFLKTKMDTKKEVSGTLESMDIAKIDSKYIKNKSVKAANDALDERILKGDLPTPEEQAQILQATQAGMGEELASMGNQRFFKPSEVSTKTWNDAFKDLEWDVQIDVTGESSTAKDDLVTLSTIFQTIADPAKRAVLQTQEGKMLFNKILLASNTVSPMEITDMPSIATPVSPAGGEVGAGGLTAQVQ